MHFVLRLLEKYHRQLISLLASLLCALLVQDWYLNSGIAQTKDETGVFVAKLVEIKNEVQRRPTKRLTWQSLRNEESLFEGEQVRTQHDAWARLAIPGGTGFIYVEPSSLISFDRRGDELVLDFLKGNIFVNGSGGAILKVRTDGRELKVAGADLVLEKKAGQRANAHVTSGAVEGVTRLEDAFLPILPAPYATLYVSPGEEVSWSWKRELPKSSDVRLLVGPSRDKLAAIPARLGSHGFKARLAAGEYFWQLTSEDKGGERIVSQTYFVKVVSKQPVLPLSPAEKATVTYGMAAPNVTFSWDNPAGLVDIVLELSASREFHTVGRAVRASEAGLMQVAFTEQGTYFGRFTGKVPGTGEVLMSKVTEFTVQKEDTTPPNPELLFPAEKAEVKIELGEALALSWAAARDTRAYRVKLKNIRMGTEAEFIASATNFSLPDLAEGAYEWQVVAIGTKSTRREPMENSSVTGSFRLTHALLNSPAYEDGTADILKSNARGEVAFGWKPVQKAKAYEVELLDASGKVLSGEKTDSTKSSVKKLKPGQYALRVMAIDSQGRRSPASEPKALVVPNRSDLRAPKLINVEVDE